MLYHISTSLQNQYASHFFVSGFILVIFSNLSMMGQLQQVVEDMSIQANVPALAMEEVIKSHIFL